MGEASEYVRTRLGVIICRRNRGKRIMNKRNTKIKHIVRCIPVMISVFIIFALTLQDPRGSVELSNNTRSFLADLCDRIGISSQGKWWNTAVHIRWLAHLAEYFLLGITAEIAFVRVLWVFFFCFGISLLDQIVKIFVPVRHFDIRDIPFDMAGYGLGISAGYLILMMIFMFVENRKEKGRNDERTLSGGSLYK